MAARALVDTGVLLALVSRSDSWHAAAVDVYNNTPLPLLTSEAVLTEAFHLSYRELGNVSSLWRLLRSGAVQMMGLEDNELGEIELLMRTYADRRMDFADATLVHLASREQISLILTVDHDDFETYRIAGRKKFTVLPARKTR
jgi:predicted nucleic acid-binding protein